MIVYFNKATEISAKHKPLWSENVVSQSNGTLHCIHANRQIMQEILEMIEDGDGLRINTHLQYNL